MMKKIRDLPLYTRKIFQKLSSLEANQVNMGSCGDAIACVVILLGTFLGKFHNSWNKFFLGIPTKIGGLSIAYSYKYASVH